MKKTIIMEFEYEEGEDKGIFEVFGMNVDKLTEQSDKLMRYMLDQGPKTKTAFFIDALEDGILTSEHLIVLALTKWNEHMDEVMEMMIEKVVEELKESK